MTKKNFVVLAILTCLAIFFFWRGLSNFFTQDDFILIDQFSQNNLTENISNIFGKPKVTHWRPIHNLYFAIGGSVFGKNYVGYHLITLIVHIATGYLIFKTTKKIVANEAAASIAAVIYLTNPSHFVSIYWISGGATVLGFFFFVSSFYSLIQGKKLLAGILFILSLLASEAMIVGSLIFLTWTIFKGRLGETRKFLLLIFALALIFLTIRFFIFTPQTTFGAYKLDLSVRILSSIKYYAARIIGLPEAGSIYFKYLFLTVLAFTLKNIKVNKGFVIFCFSIIFLGLFPFTLLPEHLSPHYMNISIWGFAMLVSLAISKYHNFRQLSLITLICVYYFGAVLLTINNNWVVTRAILAQTYIKQIEDADLEPGSKLIFKDGAISTSREAYISLGTGKAINFWFRDKNYKTCFAFLKNCE